MTGKKRPKKHQVRDLAPKTLKREGGAADAVRGGIISGRDKNKYMEIKLKEVLI